MAQEIELHRSLDHDNIVTFVSSFQGKSPANLSRDSTNRII